MRSSTCTATVPSRMNTLSVTSSSSRSGGRPLLASAEATTATKAGLWSCSGETLTATRVGDGPARRLVARRAQHPFADRRDQPRILGQRHELGRRDHRRVRDASSAATPRTRSARRCRRRPPAGNSRCISPFSSALAQRHFEHAALLGLDVELRLVGVEGAAAGILRAIQREVGRADQHFGGAPVARADRDADRRADIERVLVDLIGPRQRVDDRPGPAARCGRVSVASRTTTANSSPPSRPMISFSVTSCSSRSDTRPSKRSPTGWPSESLTALKRSRSIIMKAQRVPHFSASAIARASVSLRSAGGWAARSACRTAPCG